MDRHFLTMVTRGAAIGSVLLFSSAASSIADETDARAIVTGMADYVGSLDAFSFGFNEYHEVVTTDGEKLGLAGSGTVAVARPDRISVSRNTGFTNVDLAFDGQDLSILDEASALFARQSLPGTLDALIDTLRDDFGRPLPAADLLTGIGHSSLVQSATEVKDLGTGVVSGTLCDHLAFRGEEADWQLWIAQGDAPYPCMIIITSRNVAQAPQYRFEVRDWRPDTAGAAFTLDKPDAATEVGMAAFVSDAPAFPENYTLEAPK